MRLAGNHFLCLLTWVWDPPHIGMGFMSTKRVHNVSSDGSKILSSRGSTVSGLSSFRWFCFLIAHWWIFMPFFLNELTRSQLDCSAYLRGTFSSHWRRLHQFMQHGLVGIHQPELVSKSQLFMVHVGGTPRHTNIPGIILLGSIVTMGA